MDFTESHPAIINSNIYWCSSTTFLVGWYYQTAPFPEEKAVEAQVSLLQNPEPERLEDRAGWAWDAESRTEQ